MIGEKKVGQDEDTDQRIGRTDDERLEWARR